MNELLVTSLALDIVGAVFLARGIALVSTENWAKGHEVFGGGTADADFAKESSYATAGIVLLVLGFAGQALSASGVDGHSPWWFVGLALVPGVWSLTPRLRAMRATSLARAREAQRLQ